MANHHEKNISELKPYRRQLRQYGTSAEAALWSMLKGKKVEGLQFRRQFSVAHHILDFYSPSLRLAIELDGDYHYNAVNSEADLRRDEELLNNYGIRTLRFENKVVFEHPEYITHAIVEYLREKSAATVIRSAECIIRPRPSGAPPLS